MGWRHDWYWPPTEGHIQPEDEATMRVFAYATICLVFWVAVIAALIVIL